MFDVSEYAQVLLLLKIFILCAVTSILSLLFLFYCFMEDNVPTYKYDKIKKVMKPIIYLSALSTVGVLLIIMVIITF